MVKTSAPEGFMPRLAIGDGSAPGIPSPGAGQIQQFRDLILPHLDGAYNLARYLTRDPVLGEDVAHDAMLRAFRAFGQFRGGSPRAWIFAIVRNCCRTAQADNKGAMALVVHESGLGEDATERLNAHPDPAPDPEESLERKRAIDHVREAIEAMPEPFREAIVLRELEELSYAEIAEVTGVPIGTVMSRLARGRAILTKELLLASSTDDEQSRSAK
jgi:RNA polymerase sigma factor (sigma-70 family)